MLVLHLCIGARRQPETCAVTQRKKETAPQIADDPNLGRYGFMSSDGDSLATRLEKQHASWREDTDTVTAISTQVGVQRGLSRSALSSHCFTSGKTAKLARHEPFQPTSAWSGTWGTFGRADASSRLGTDRLYEILAEEFREARSRAKGCGRSCCSVEDQYFDQWREFAKAWWGRSRFQHTFCDLIMDTFSVKN